MQARAASQLAWSLWAVSLAVTAAALALLALTGFTYPPEVFAFPGFAAAVGIAYATVGAFVASRRPSNAIGWLFVTMGLISSVQELSTAYAVSDWARESGDLSGVAVAAWVVDWIWIPITGGLLVYPFALFPDGRLHGRAAKVAAAVGGLGIAMLVAGSMIRPGPLQTFEAVDNPFAIAGTTGLVNVLEFGFGLVAGAGSVAVIGMTLRWRGATGVARQQYRWLLVAGTILALTFAVLSVATVTGVDVDRYWVLMQLVLVLGFTAIPVTVGFAILRYRLYDIDRVISRTVTYALVIGVLIGVYVTGVLLLGRLLPRQSDVGVAASTLAAAALFNPLRRRVQHLVDRRFNRARYDAGHIVDDFGTTLREELDVDAMATGLVAVVATTVQPATVSLWVPGDDR